MHTHSLKQISTHYQRLRNCSDIHAQTSAHYTNVHLGPGLRLTRARWRGQDWVWSGFAQRRTEECMPAGFDMDIFVRMSILVVNKLLHPRAHTPSLMLNLRSQNPREQGTGRRHSATRPNTEKFPATCLMVWCRPERQNCIDHPLQLSDERIGDMAAGGGPAATLCSRSQHRRAVYL